jgi:flagellar motility protein MotE (MotC chaperone)
LSELAAPQTTPAEVGKGKKSAANSGGGVFRFVLVVCLFGLLARLIVSGFYLTSDAPIHVLPTPPNAEAAIAPAAASVPAPVVAVQAVSSMASGAAALVAMSSSGALAAEPAIPLAPGDEDLLRPQKPPSVQNQPAQPAGTPAPPRSVAPQLPPNQVNNNAREEALNRREFELNRREDLLNTREEALKNLESDVNTRILAAERAKGEMETLIARNQAILDEQKALREQQQAEDEQLKDARIEHLVTAFKSMKPEQAGALITSMDDAVAVSILSAMPGSNAGKILAMVTPDKAARLVKSISEQRIDPKALLQAATQQSGI